MTLPRPGHAFIDFPLPVHGPSLPPSSGHSNSISAKSPPDPDPELTSYTVLSADMPVVLNSSVEFKPPGHESAEVMYNPSHSRIRPTTLSATLYSYQAHTEADFPICIHFPFIYKERKKAKTQRSVCHVYIYQRNQQNL